MKINYGLVFRLATDPRSIETKSGKLMLSLFSISNKRRKVGGHWEDDPYYDALKVNAIAFGDTAQALLEAGLKKGDTIIITDGQMVKRKSKDGKAYNDVEVIVNDFELMDNQKGTTAKAEEEVFPASADELPF